MNGAIQSPAQEKTVQPPGDEGPQGQTGGAGRQLEGPSKVTGGSRRKSTGISEDKIGELARREAGLEPDLEQGLALASGPHLPATGFCIACELRIVFTFLSD